MSTLKITYKDFIDYKTEKKRIFNIIFSSVFSLVFIFYSFLHIYYYEKNFFMAISLLVMSLIFALNVVYLLLKGNVEISSNVLLLLSIILMFFTVLYGANTDFRLVWFCIIPLLSFYLKSHIKGIIFVIIAIFALFLSFIINAEFTIIKFPIKQSSFIDIFVIFLAISVASFYYEYINLENERYILRQLFTDSLTNIPNRTSLINDISNKLGNKLVLINIDNFKHINDLYGNKIGDAVLIEMCKRLIDFRSNIKPEFYIYKLHADEFALLFPSEMENKILENLIINLQQQLTQVYFIENLELLLTITMGISTTGEKLLEEADMALKHAKESKEPYLFFDSSMRIKEKYEENIFWVKQIKRAITNDNIIPFYQPIYNNKTKKIEKFESLIRMIDGENIITPDKFLEIAKRSKYYTHLTKIILLKSVKYFLNKTYDFSINLSLYDVYSKESTEFFISVIDDFNIGERLIFEFTEIEQIEDNRQVTFFIEKVKERGCKIAIDDFGSGYSNFDYLFRMNVDIIKIDGSLIQNLLKNKESKAIVESIVTFASKLNIKTVAEFVSSKEIFNEVNKLGINYSQGYFIGKPSLTIEETISAEDSLLLL